MKKKNNRYCLNCRNSFRKDDRNNSIACYDGNNFNFKTYTYEPEYATKCKWYEERVKPNTYNPDLQIEGGGEE